MVSKEWQRPRAAGRGARMWRQKLMWRHEDTWRIVACAWLRHQASDAPAGPRNVAVEGICQLDVASERGVNSSRGFSEACGVAGRDIAMWRQEPRTEVASLDTVLVCGVRGSGASQHVSSECFGLRWKYAPPRPTPLVECFKSSKKLEG